MPVTATKESRQEPWFGEYLESFVSGYAKVFGIHGDIYGLTTEGKSQIDHLKKEVSKRPIVVLYDREQGISFLRRDDRENANILLEGKSNLPQGQSANIQAAFAASMGKAAPAAKKDEFADRPDKIIDELRLIERLMTVIDPAQVNQKEMKTTDKSSLARVVAIINRADLICPPYMDKGMMADEARDILALLCRWGQSQEFAKFANPVFLLTSKKEELHPDLRGSNSGIKFIEIALPKEEERSAFIGGFLARRETIGKSIRLVDVTAEQIAKEAAGLSNRHIEDVLLMGYRSGGVTHSLVASRKRQIISDEFSEIAEMLDPLAGGFSSMGGMEWMVDWMRRKVIQPIRAGSKRSPKGILLVGAPGTGKTRLVRALAGELNFNVLVLNASNILSKWVGESEQQLKRFLAYARQQTPTIIFIDEADQGPFGQRGREGDSVGGNLFNQILTFTGDESIRGKVILILATNEPRKLDPAILRPGRIEVRVPFFLPQEEARQGMYRVHAKEHGVSISEEAVLLAAKKSENYAPADIMAVVLEALDIMDENEHEVLGVEELEMALQYVKPSCSPERADYYTKAALEFCNNSRFLQQNYASILADQGQLSRDVTDLAASFGEDFSTETRW